MSEVRIKSVRGTPSFGTFSYRQTAQTLDEAAAWFAAKGRRIDGTRIARYRNDLNRLADDFESGRLIDSFEAASGSEKGRLFADAMVSLYESGEVISIYEGIKAVAHLLERDALKRVLKGPISYLDETDLSSHARNAAFELIIASRVAEAGFPLVPLRPADLCFRVGHHRLVFECKRPRFLSTVEENIGDAFSQLRKRTAVGFLPRLRGIAAIDVTRAANPDFRRIVVPDENALMRALGDYVNDYARGNMMHWERKARSRKIIGVMVRFSGIAEITSERRPVYAQQYSLASIAHSPADREAMRTLATALQAPPGWASVAVNSSASIQRDA
jgi:hypothetical protein